MQSSTALALGTVLLGLSSANALAGSVARESVQWLSFSSMDVGYDDHVGLTGGNSVFDLVDNGNDSVTLTSLQEVAEGTSSAVIGQKFGGQGDNQRGNFRFDAADFNRGTTLRFSWDPPFTGDGISHASVYANSVTPGGGGSGQGGGVPEPATFALMRVGLAGGVPLQTNGSPHVSCKWLFT